MNDKTLTLVAVYGQFAARLLGGAKIILLKPGEPKEFPAKIAYEILTQANGLVVETRDLEQVKPASVESDGAKNAGAKSTAPSRAKAQSAAPLAEGQIALETPAE